MMKSAVELAVRTACILLVVATTARLLPADEDLAALEEQAVKDAVDRVSPSVVRIETVGGLDRVGELLVGSAPSTGLVVSEDGFIISSAFNFAQKPDSILVTLPAGSRHTAKLIATDHSRMIVLLKIDAPKKLDVPTVVPQGELRVGQWTIAVGRTFEGGEPNVSVGIISAVGRIWSKAIQTDAKISPSNYGGPLIDISGRVLGVLAPLSPEASQEAAGVDWYDSGIGFAVPLEHIQSVLPKLEGGHDLLPGVFGISLNGSDMFSQPPVIGACRANSPAYKAGFKAGDKIVEINGQPIGRIAQLKHQTAKLYAGDKMHVVALRGAERIERDVELVDKLEPYEFPFLGLLPTRPASEPKNEKPLESAAGISVRFVYADSPAAKSGLIAGDKILAFQGEKVGNAGTIAEKLRTMAVGEKVDLEIARGGETQKLELKLGQLPVDVPSSLPAAHDVLGPMEGSRPAVGTVTVKIPQFANECLAYVPENYDPRLAYGVVIWLHAPGGFDQEALVSRWKTHCEEHELILLAPKAADSAKWQPTEAAFVRKALDDVRKNYRIDSSRVVVHGHEGGGALAYLVALANLDVVRAVAVVDAPLPLLIQLPETDPLHSLAFYSAEAKNSKFAPLIEKGVTRLRELKHPLTQKDLGDEPRYLSADELAELVRWIDTLDRL